MRRKKKIETQPVAVRLKPDLIEWLDAIAAEEGLSKGAVIRRVLLKKMREERGRAA